VTAPLATGHAVIDALPDNVRTSPRVVRAIHRFFRAWWQHQILARFGGAREDAMTDARDRLYMAADALTAEVTE